MLAVRCKAVIVVNSSRNQVISVYIYKKNCGSLKFQAEAHIFESVTLSDFLDHSNSYTFQYQTFLKPYL